MTEEEYKEEEEYLDINECVYLEKLYLNSAIPQEVDRSINAIVYERNIPREYGLYLISYLEQNQRDLIQGGFNYQARDIKNKLNNLT